MDSRGQCSVYERLSDVAYELTRKCGLDHIQIQPNWAAAIDFEPDARKTRTPSRLLPYVPRYSTYRRRCGYLRPKYQWSTRNTIYRRPESNNRRRPPFVPQQNVRMPGNVPTQFSNFPSNFGFANSGLPYQRGGWRSEYYPGANSRPPQRYGTYGNHEIIPTHGQNSNMYRASAVDSSVPPPMYHGSDMRSADARHLQPPIHGYPLNPSNAAQNFRQPNAASGPGQVLQNESFQASAGPVNYTGYSSASVNYYPGNSNTPTVPMHENQGVRYAYPGLLSNGSDAQQNPYRQASMGHNIPYPAPGHYRQYAPMGRNTSSPGMGYNGQVPGVAYGYQPAQPTISYGNTQSNMTPYPTPPPDQPQYVMQNFTLVGYLCYPVYMVTTVRNYQVAGGQSAGQYSNYGDPNSQPAGNEQMFQTQNFATGSEQEQWESYGQATGYMPTAHPYGHTQPALENPLFATPQLYQGSEDLRTPQGAQGLQEYRPDAGKPRRLRVWEATDAELEALGCMKLDRNFRKYLPFDFVDTERCLVDDLLKVILDFIDKLDMTDHLDKEKEKE